MTTAAVLASYGLPAWRFLTLPGNDVELITLTAVAKRAGQLEEQAAKRAQRGS